MQMYYGCEVFRRAARPSGQRFDTPAERWVVRSIRSRRRSLSSRGTTAGRDMAAVGPPCSDAADSVLIDYYGLSPRNRDHKVLIWSASTIGREAIMRTSWDLTAIHIAITRAAADPSCWTPTLERIATASGAVGAALLPIKISDRPLGLTGTAGRSRIDGPVHQGRLVRARLAESRYSQITLHRDHGGSGPHLACGAGHSSSPYDPHNSLKSIFRDLAFWHADLVSRAKYVP